MDEFIPMDQMGLADAEVAMALAMAVGSLSCFAGYRALRLFLGALGFGLAAHAAWGVLERYAALGETATLALTVVGGVAGALALTFVYRAGLFVLGALGAGLIAYAILGQRPEEWAPWAIIGACLAGGVAAQLFERPLVAIATAAIGAWAVVCGYAFFRYGAGAVDGWALTITEGSVREVLLLVWAVLGLAGAVVQFTGFKGYHLMGAR